MYTRGRTSLLGSNRMRLLGSPQIHLACFSNIHPSMAPSPGFDKKAEITHSLAHELNATKPASHVCIHIRAKSLCAGMDLGFVSSRPCQKPVPPPRP